MIIFKTARFAVKPDALAECERLIREFVDYVRANEPHTRLYSSWQERDDPATCVHFFIFDDETAEERHRTSSGVQRFVAGLYPNLASDGVVFTDHRLVATTSDQRPDTRP